MAEAKDVKSQTDEELIAWAEEIEDGLTNWEMNFVDDQHKWLREHGSLTGKQRAKLEQIVIAKG